MVTVTILTIHLTTNTAPQNEATLSYHMCAGYIFAGIYFCGYYDGINIQVEDPSILVRDEGIKSLVALLKSPAERLINQSCVAMRNLASQPSLQVLTP